MKKNYIDKMKIFYERRQGHLFIANGEILKSFDIKSKFYKNEFNIVNKLKHPNIIKFKDSFYRRNKFFVVMNNYPEGDMWHIIKKKKLTNKEQIEISAQLAKPIAYLHFNGYVHLDIKPENYLSTKNQENLILIDFEHAREFKKFDKLQKLDFKVGTPYYMAPEIHNLKFGTCSDIYSLGTIFYLMIAKRLPDKDDIDWSRISNSPLEPIIVNMLQPQPELRPNIFEVNSFLRSHLSKRLT